MKDKLGLVTGSFDPITVGHLDIIERAASIFDRITVVVANNEEKTYMFSPTERLALVKEAVKDLENVNAMLCDGYVADFAMEHSASAFVRGIRDGNDVAYEQNMADINYANSGGDTVMLFAKTMYHDISSTKVRAAIKSRTSLDALMPKDVSALALEFISRR